MNRASTAMSHGGPPAPTSSDNPNAASRSPPTTRATRSTVPTFFLRITPFLQRAYVVPLSCPDHTCCQEHQKHDHGQTAEQHQPPVLPARLVIAVLHGYASFPRWPASLR